MNFGQINPASDLSFRPTDGEVVSFTGSPGPGDAMRFVIRVRNGEREDTWTDVPNWMPAPEDYDMVAPKPGTPVVISWFLHDARVCIPWLPRTTNCGGQP